MFSLAEGVVDFRTLGELFGRFDVVHLHWMVGMFDYKHGGEVLADKPVAWTLADMNAFTGGCHYSEGCEEYTRQCRRCPMLGEDSDLAHLTWKAKRRAYAGIKNLHVVCPSPWMAERARESSLLGDRPIHCIPNAYPVSRLAMTAKAVARVRLGLPLRRKLLLFGAESVTNHRKGGDLLAEAVARFCASGPHDDVEVVVFGRNSLDIGLPVHRMGYINDDETLALVYSAADAYLFPSREDNAPLTVGESLLCGTPVVAFPVGNVPSVVEHRVTGYIARPLDVEDFARGIRWGLDATPAAALARSARCRLSAAALHDPATAAQRHEAVYRLALGEAA
jgi:glycosyltransferase involved in cell wall biosynthesis